MDLGEYGPLVSCLSQEEDIVSVECVNDPGVAFQGNQGIKASPAKIRGDQADERTRRDGLPLQILIHMENQRLAGGERVHPHQE